MKMNKLVKSSVATSMALLLLSGTANAEGKITPVSVKKVDDKVTLYKTTATADSDKFKISQILTFNFIVKSRLLCKMLYNVFTISTYQN
ncbi:gamma-hemolysin component B [Staphylococcus aureus DAR5888]|uniref:Uncharacterized protein n=1 Tax=Staphylococcus aureus TaxID=1280 RepID=A0AAP7JX54_STAAU|nr:gamma-hemolysin component B [Staphylococcus aureus DAR5844]EUK14003.1 gamma-hemolysin component B [Staphylococcus aureus DAR5842]EXN99968.1 gamma-hemolysin component B [Staphylococcus aureus DAR5845]EXO02740.1 gamma-hemolysin component B [Staphylococcus aureus DAR5843]EXO13471.1 gamma-hemolysin component B [Staphylococcus aureus DAR5848]EYO79460.1 gamma-hemolysin component B [Staphylococcus aureus DAR5880]EYO85877.1 gamma-hemolysin component B [Staphylococcus aureus DAR5878]EYR26356.1 gam